MMLIRILSDYIQNVLWKKVGIVNILFLPFSLLYYLASIFRYYVIQKPKKVAAKVICIGNVVAGGSGKTPGVCAIAKAISSSGKKVAIISKGYRGQLVRKDACIKVDNKTHNHNQIGDEALLLSTIAPTYISKDRFLAANTATQDGAEIIILDDGLQDNSIHKDYNILAINKFNFKNKYLIPAGPFREGLNSIHQKCDFVMYPYTLQQLNSLKTLNKIKFRIRYKEIIMNIDELKKEKFVLLTGIANPKRVQKSLASKNINILKHYAFPDHYKFTHDDLKPVYKKAKITNCNVLTTSKDYVRIPNAFKQATIVIKYELRFVENDLSKLVNSILTN